MATDGPTPPDCDPKPYKRGITVAWFETRGACAFEDLIKQVREDTGVPVDWHYVGGRAVVRAFLCDEAVVRKAVARIISPVLRGSLC